MSEQEEIERLNSAIEYERNYKYNIGSDKNKWICNFRNMIDQSTHEIRNTLSQIERQLANIANESKWTIDIDSRLSGTAVTMMMYIWHWRQRMENEIRNTEWNQRAVP